MLRTTTIDRKKLIETITANRTRHVEEFIAAQDKWIEHLHDEAVDLVLSTTTDRRLTGATITRPTAEQRELINVAHRATCVLHAPTLHTDEYDTALQQLSMDVRETIEITSDDFRRLVQDEWDWMGHFAMTLDSYGVKNDHRSNLIAGRRVGGLING